VAAEAWAARLVPEPFRDFLPYASPAALRVVRPTQVLRRALDVAQNVSRPAVRSEHAARLQASLVDAGLGAEVRVVDEPGPRWAADQLSASERVAIGQRVLALYFHQLFWDGPLFLDLRPRHLGWDTQRQQLQFYPTSLWCRPDDDFMVRLRSLYAGFYEADANRLAEGLELYRWKCEPSPGFATRMQRLLQDHFGAPTGHVQFAVSHFRSTFDAIFKEAEQSQAFLHPDLTFLGVELIGLYLSLESLAVPLGPQAAFVAAKKSGGKSA
jgi:hypothetical protein